MVCKSQIRQIFGDGGSIISYYVSKVKKSPQAILNANNDVPNPD
jgi:hypothetical protein